MSSHAPTRRRPPHRRPPARPDPHLPARRARHPVRARWRTRSRPGTSSGSPTGAPDRGLGPHPRPGGDGRRARRPRRRCRRLLGGGPVAASRLRARTGARAHRPSPHRGGPHLGIVHTSVRFSPDDVIELRGIPVTSPLRTLCDLAGRLHHDRLDLLCERMLSKRLLRVAAAPRARRRPAPHGRRPGHRGDPTPRARAWPRPPAGRERARAPLRVDPPRRRRAALRTSGRPGGRRRLDRTGRLRRSPLPSHRRGAERPVPFRPRSTAPATTSGSRGSVGPGGPLLEIREFDIWHRPDRVVAVRAARRAARRRRRGGSPDQPPKHVSQLSMPGERWLTRYSPPKQVSQLWEGGGQTRVTVPAPGTMWPTSTARMPLRPQRVERLEDVALGHHDDHAEAQVEHLRHLVVGHARRGAGSR